MEAKAGIAATFSTKGRCLEKDGDSLALSSACSS